MDITINGKVYKVKYSIRAMMAFEKIAEKNFEIKNLTDMYIFYYCMILAGVNESPLTFDEFIDACDDEPALLNQFSELMNKHNKIKDSFAGKKESKKSRNIYKYTRYLYHISGRNRLISCVCVGFDAMV